MPNEIVTTEPPADAAVALVPAQRGARGRWSSKAPVRMKPVPLVIATLTSVIALVALVAIGEALHEPVLIPPLAASMALVAGAPNLPLGQPRNVIGGQLVSGLVGLATYAVTGDPGSSLWSAGIAGGLALGAMLLVRVSHSPAAATAVIAAHQGPRPVLFLALLALATVVLVLTGIVGARAAGNRQYPVYWW